MSTRITLAGLATAAVASAIGGPAMARDFPPFPEVSKEYEQVVSTIDGSPSLYAVWIDRKKNQLLAELPRGWQNQRHLVAITQSRGGIFAGLQGPDVYVRWERYDDRLALIAPELGTRSTGEPESRDSVERLFTDRVLFEVPIVCMGPNGQPVIDLDDLLINRAAGLLGGGGRFGGGGGMNARLAKVTSAKAFPQNIEVEIEAPGPGGAFVAYHYSISDIPQRSSYKPREADERVGYFTTVYRDLGEYHPDAKWKRYINRWQLEKRDPKLSLSPPKEPIVYYIEHTVPVRYRRWIRQGIEHWNEAFRNIGIDGAIEVVFQDKETGAHMEKDPEDVRYNFIRWLNNDISTAIGPSRAHPLTGQILDADVVLTDGWIRAYWGWYYQDSPEIAVEGMSPETLTWLEKHPDWDPRLLLVAPERRNEILDARAERARRIASGEPVAPLPRNPVLAANEDLHAIADWMGDEDKCCLMAHGMAANMAFASMAMDAMGLLGMDGDEGAPEGDKLDGIPEWFVGPMVAELVCHEVGHTLGLRHNFKASSIYSMEQINSAEWKGKKAMGGSVMDYLPPNFNYETGETQGDFCMIKVGPYDQWAIEYGYGFGDTKKVLERVNDPELVYLTDDDLGGPDPLARQYDFSAEPLTYAHNQMRIVNLQRDKLLDKLVKDGQSWSKARAGYERSLSMHVRMIGMMANWVGGAHVYRNRKGDPDGKPPVEVVSPEKQRSALSFVIDHAFYDEAFGLSPEMMAYLTVDKWSDDSQGDRGDPTWPVHDRVYGIQNMALTMIMNPTTLGRVLDNELRTPAGDDALTLPEVLQTVMDAVYTELGADLDGATWTNRMPMISSLRRNLQSSMTDRLIVLASDDNGLPRAVRTLCLHHLRTLDGRLGELVEKAGRGQVDAYTMAHLEDLQDRVRKALDRVYVTAN